MLRLNLDQQLRAKIRPLGKCLHITTSGVLMLKIVGYRLGKIYGRLPGPARKIVVSLLLLGFVWALLPFGKEPKSETNVPTPHQIEEKNAARDDFAENCFLIKEKVAPLYGKKFAIDAAIDSTCSTTENMPGFIQDTLTCSIAFSLKNDYEKNKGYEEANANAFKACMARRNNEPAPID